MSKRAQIYQFLSQVFAFEVTDAQVQPYFAVLGLKNDRHDTAAVVTDLAVDYARIFLAAGVAQGKAAFPYESVYTDRLHLVSQASADEINQILEKENLKCNPDMFKIPDDHISVILSLMNHYAGQTETADLIAKERKLLKSHLLNWVEPFCTDIGKYAQTEFYKAAAKQTVEFLNRDLAYLENRIDHIDIDTLCREGRVIGPTRLTGAMSGKTGYGEIRSADDLVLDCQTDFSAKETVLPILQRMFSFEAGKVADEKCDDEPLTILAKPCDMSGFDRLDTLFLGNGIDPDYYYRRQRQSIKVVPLKCEVGFEGCFCRSVGADKVGSDLLKSDFPGKNLKTVAVPAISPEKLAEIWKLPLWQDIAKDCISCGRCTAVCPTCSCFNTVDVIYDQTSLSGERRRLWASCMHEDFGKMAGGHNVRPEPQDRLRFRLMHKIYDFEKRFGKGKMCVGCGRCDAACPKDISLKETLNKLAEVL